MHAILITEILNTFIKGKRSSQVECSTFIDEFYIIAQTFGYFFLDVFKMPVNLILKIGKCACVNISTPPFYLNLLRKMFYICVTKWFIKKIVCMKTFLKNFLVTFFEFLLLQLLNLQRNLVFAFAMHGTSPETLHFNKYITFWSRNLKGFSECEKFLGMILQ